MTQAYITTMTLNLMRVAIRDTLFGCHRTWNNHKGVAQRNNSKASVSQKGMCLVLFYTTGWFRYVKHYTERTKKAMIFCARKQRRFKYINATIWNTGRHMEIRESIYYCELSISFFIDSSTEWRKLIASGINRSRFRLLKAFGGLWAA